MKVKVINDDSPTVGLMKLPSSNPLLKQKKQRPKLKKKDSVKKMNDNKFSEK